MRIIDVSAAESIWEWLLRDNMPTITVTDFADFLLKVGVSRITKVAEIFNREKYDPKRDFWKPLRDCIREHHTDGGALTFSATNAAPKKMKLYDAAIKGYRKFLGSVDFEHFDPHPATWQFEDLTIKVNPEIGLLIGGKKYLVKLYFKREPLSAQRVKAILGVMVAAYKSKTHICALLNVPKAKLHSQDAVPPHIEALIKGEALAFLSIWNSLSQHSS